MDSQLEIERWRGTVDQRLSEHERRLTGINGSVADSAKALSNVALELSKLSTSLHAAQEVSTRWAGWIVPVLFSTLGAVASGVVVFFLTNG